MSQPKLLFLVTRDWSFCSHRLQLGIAARKAGYDVIVVTEENNHGDVIRQAGLRLIPIKFPRSGKNPFSDFMTLRSLIRIYKNEQPDLIHHVSLKPVLYGSIAAKFLESPNIINAMTGLGYVFSSEDFFAKIIRFLISPLLKYFFADRRSMAIFQNQDDLKTLEDRNMITHERAVIIRGCGIELDIYVPRPGGGKDIPQVVLMARMLWDKGVGEFVQAAKLLLARNISANLILIGGIDTENPTAISAEQLKIWQEEGIIKWWGRRDDIPEILQQSTIACLPSYGEGLPRSLLEAASAGLPIVATDVPGCREAVINGENGYLVPPRNPTALADAIEKLLNDESLRRDMGVKSRALAEREFAVNKINNETISLYQHILN